MKTTLTIPLWPYRWNSGCKHRRKHERLPPYNSEIFSSFFRCWTLL